MKANKLKVSIIIPVYNAANYIKRCLDAVYRQRYTEIETILVDDACTDGSIKIAEALIQEVQWPNIRIIKHAHNRGLSAARNTGIRAAIGEYLYFLDADDDITPDCIAILVALAEQYDAQLVQGNYQAIPVGWSDNNLLDEFAEGECFTDRIWIKTGILNNSKIPMMACNKLIKSDFLRHYNLFFMEGIMHEDDHWSFYIAKHLKNLVICKIPTYRYYKNQGSIMNAADTVQRSTASFKRILKDWQQHVDDFCLRQQLDLIFKKSYGYYQQSDFKDIEFLQILLAFFEQKDPLVQQINRLELFYKRGFLAPKMYAFLLKIYLRFAKYRLLKIK